MVNCVDLGHFGLGLDNAFCDASYFDATQPFRCQRGVRAAVAKITRVPLPFAYFNLWIAVLMQIFFRREALRAAGSFYEKGEKEWKGGEITLTKSALRILHDRDMVCDSDASLGYE